MRTTLPLTAHGETLNTRPRKDTHPGHPGFPFLHDFRDPVVITGMTQVTCMMLMDTVSFQSMSGAEWPSINWSIQLVEIIIIQGQMEGSY